MARPLRGVGGGYSLSGRASLLQIFTVLYTTAIFLNPAPTLYILLGTLLLQGGRILRGSQLRTQVNIMVLVLDGNSGIDAHVSSETR